MDIETDKSEELSKITNKPIEANIGIKRFFKWEKAPKEVEVVRCKKCNKPLLYNKFSNTYICTQCNMAYKQIRGL